MPRLKLTISYVGTNYCGWQIQDNAPTIQAELEKVLQKVIGEPVRIHGAGRTDSGVHAEGQVAHVDVSEDKLNLDWQRIFNTSLPQDISIRSVEQVADDFHSRYDAKSKTYAYTFWTDRAFIPPRLRPFVWDCGPLDLQSMRKALAHLRGRHDFACFQNTGTPIEDTVRMVYGASIDEGSPWLTKEHTENILTLSITANGFLKQMVRNIAGLMVAIGRGSMEDEDVPSLLASKNRKDAPATAPASGLTLLSVRYNKK